MNAIRKLKVELDADPLSRGYESMNAKEVAADINSKIRQKKRPITMPEFRTWATVGARAFKIYSGISDEALTDQTRNSCLLVDRLLSTDRGVIDPSNDAHVSLINSLVSGNVLTAGDRSALVLVGTDLISRAEELGYGGVVKVGHVLEARRMQ